MATKNTQKIGWIGMGRMGFPMAERLIKAGHDVSIWNRTRAKAEPLAKIGGKVVDHPIRSRNGVDVLFSIVATGKDVQEVLLRQERRGRQGGKMPPIVVDCSTIAVEESAAIRQAQAARRRFRRRAGERQRQGDQGRQALRRGLGRRSGVQDRRCR